MSKARITWSYPTTRVSGGALDQAAIQGAEIEVKGPADADFVALAAVTYPLASALTGELALGLWEFRGVCVLKNGKRSAPVTASVTITDESAPEVLLDLSAVVEE
jgi:expansin (peptidoglycan-binding protein)